MALDAATETRAGEPTRLERNTVLWLTNASHAVNHFQNNMVGLLYVVIMPDLGFGYTELGILTAVRSITGGMLQGMYGFVTPFIPRAWILGIGNIVLGAGTFATGTVGTFGGFLAARGVAAAGSSAQHPIGGSLLASYFPTRRGTVLALNASISNIGSLVAPMAAVGLLLIMDWRQIFYIVAVLSIAMGGAYFLFRRRVVTTGPESGGRAKLVQGWASYRRVFRNRNMILVSLVMMVGGAGRDVGVNLAYLGPHMANDLGLNLTMVGAAITVMQVGGVVGPIGFGYLSDRMSRKRVIQATLALSSFATLWLAFQGQFLPGLLVSLLFYGTVTRSRMVLTQALVADSLDDRDMDAAFSVFFLLGVASAPFWAILVGVLMDSYGFTFAFSVLAVSYVAGMLLMLFVVDPKRTAVAQPSG